MAELAAAGEEVTYEPGDRMFDEGRPAEHWWVMLEGCIDLVRRVGNEEAVMVTIENAGQWAGGFQRLGRATASTWDRRG